MARGCAVCAADISAKRSTAKFCSVACQKRWHYCHGGREKRGHVERVPRTPPPPLVPLIDAPDGHAWYDEARSSLRSWERHELGSDMDSGARDLLQEWALARLEDRDPWAALTALRRRHAKDRAVLVHGLVLVDGLGR